MTSETNALHGGRGARWNDAAKNPRDALLRPSSWPTQDEIAHITARCWGYGTVYNGFIHLNPRVEPVAPLRGLEEEQRADDIRRAAQRDARQSAETARMAQLFQQRQALAQQRQAQVEVRLARSPRVTPRPALEWLAMGGWTPEEIVQLVRDAIREEQSK